jgi:hypothetical protein
LRGPRPTQGYRDDDDDADDDDLICMCSDYGFNEI